MEFVDEIEKRIQRRTTFVVSGILLKDLKEFKEYCLEECNNNYSIGIAQLLKTKKQYEQFLILITSLQDQINAIKHEIQLNNRRGRKTFDE